MAQFITCPSCSFCFAPYMEFFDLARQTKYQEEVFGEKSDIKDYDPEKLALNPGNIDSLKNIFDALKITNRTNYSRFKFDLEQIFNK